MKITIDLHDSRIERPEKSCEVLVFRIDSNEVSHRYPTSVLNYRKTADGFFGEQDYDPLLEEENYYFLWSCWEDVQKAIKEAEKPVETCRERLKREHPCHENERAVAGCFGCPMDYKYAKKPEYCGREYGCCSECWNRPVEIKCDE